MVMMECQRCGYCCMTAFMSINEPLEDKKEIARWLHYHHIEPCAYPARDGNGQVLAIKVPLVCMHLEQVDGKYSCKIHDKRPVVCREYFCPKVRNGIRA